jgi:hypothetical protein
MNVEKRPACVRCKHRPQRQLRNTFTLLGGAAFRENPFRPALAEGLAGGFVRFLPGNGVK